jgi:hypothetical protein
MRKTFRPKREEVEENYAMMSFIVYALHKIFLGWSYQGRPEDGTCSTHARDDKLIQNSSRIT